MCEREVTVYHHPCVVENYESVVGKWYATERRCRRCWLRDYDCYCNTIDEQAAVLRGMPLPNVDVVLYYFFSEVGRSGNTGHLLELLLPETTSSLVFGDVSREQELVDRMVREYRSGCIDTCIFYPSSDSILLSEFIAARKAQAFNAAEEQQNQQKVEQAHQQDNSERSVRLVALDGTYHTARRQFKHLRDTLLKVGVPLPVVKLDLSSQGCCSAYLGLMQQPTAEKICTLQAVALAMGQLSCNPLLVKTLLENLDGWIRYIVTRKIKLGKERVRLPKGLVIGLGTDIEGAGNDLVGDGMGKGKGEIEGEVEGDEGKDDELGDGTLFHFIEQSVQERKKKMEAKKMGTPAAITIAANTTSDELKNLLEQRAAARSLGNFDQADAIRNKLFALGLKIEDARDKV